MNQHPRILKTLSLKGFLLMYIKTTSARTGSMATLPQFGGIREGSADKYWDKMTAGDLLLFYTGDDGNGVQKYGYMATIEGKHTLPGLSTDIWIGEDGSPEWPYVTFLSNVKKVNIPSPELHDDIGWKADHLQDFRRVRPEDVRRIVGDDESVRAYLQELATTEVEIDHGSVGAGEEQKYTSRVDQEEQTPDLRRPKRTTSEVSRIVRNTSLVKQLKKEYEYRCQVCGKQRQRGPDDPYAEGHHLHPLGDDPPGPDSEENIIILCPNHHADFDYGMIQVDPDTLHVSSAYEDLNGVSLHLSPGHDLSREFLEYHNENHAMF
jgi:hypothetical protein